MSEKKLLRRLSLYGTAVILIYLLLQISTILVLGYSYTDCLYSSSDGSTLSLSDLQIETETEGIIEIRELYTEGADLYATLDPVGYGNTGILITDAETGETLSCIYLHADRLGLITNTATGNFSHYRQARLYMTLLLTAVTALLWFGFFRTQRILRYSYRSIFCIGFGIWSTLISVLMIIGSIRNMDMLNTYRILQNAPFQFVIFTSPLILLFSILLAVSNLQLIRKEGFRSKNILGILLAFVMTGGMILLFIIDNVLSSGSDTEMKIYSALTNTLASVYALYECFLTGSVICGFAAARHQPAFDKDYIVILGCKIRKDGTLYPLIRGRVDRAISFYNSQLQATGRKAVFIPTGGKGADETFSEGGAMKQYLIAQGIDETQIIAEERASNTKENMLFSKKIIEERACGTKAAFSTTNYHVFRSGIIAGQTGFDAEGMGSPTKWYFWPNAFVREVFGMTVYQWKTLAVILIPVTIFFVTSQFLLQ